MILTANGVMRGKKPIPLYEIVNAAADICGEACMLIDTSIDPSVITSRRFGFSTLRIGSSTTQNALGGSVLRVAFANVPDAIRKKGG